MSFLTSEGFEMGSIISYHFVSAEHDDLCTVSSGNGAPTALENILSIWKNQVWGPFLEKDLEGVVPLIE